MKIRNITFATILVMIPCFALLPTAQAVTPAPDGAYGPPAYGAANTAEGENALLSLSSGTNNTAVGWSSLKSLTAGAYNTAIGSGALNVNTANFNTATGAAALWSNTTGTGNTATGYSALWHNINGGSNTAIGFQALFSNTSGGGHTAVGSGALQNSHAGGLLCFGNTAVGLNALNNSTSGCGNTALGSGAGLGVTTGGGNTLIGVIAGSAVTSANNVIAIGTAGGNVSNSCYIGNIWQEPAGGIQVYVNSDGKLGYRTSSRRFKDEIKPMEQASEVIYRLQPVSFRYKPEIEPTRPLGFGLIAEDVQKISPDLVTRGGDGKVNTVDYDAVNAMLLNEFLKEHRTAQDLKSTVAKQEGTIARQRKDFETTTARQQKQLQALTATLNEQAAQLQKVSKQIEVSKFATGRIRRGGPAPQTVVNNQ